MDINVLLDVFQLRQPHYAASAKVVNLVAAGTVTGVCPAHGLTTLYYLIKKYSSKPDAEAAMDQVLDRFQVGNLDQTGWQAARHLAMPGFEDAAVATVALVTLSTFIVTRNVGDFAGSPVPAVTPANFLSRFTVQS